MDSFGLDFNSFRNSFWDSAEKPLISEVITSFEEAMSSSSTLFSILGDLDEEGTAIEASKSLESTFSTKIVELTISLTIPELFCWLFFLFWLLVDISKT